MSLMIRLHELVFGEFYSNIHNKSIDYRQCNYLNFIDIS
jgi:hypothetical protein